MGEHELLNLLDLVDIIELIKLCIRGGLTSLQLKSITVYSLLKRILELLSTESESIELDLCLRYSSMFLLVIVSPKKKCGWDEILNYEELTEDAIPLKMLLLYIINKCLELSSMDIKLMARYVVSIFIYLSCNIGSGIYKSILWLVVKCCIYSVWEVIMEEELCRVYDLACLKFLCKLNQTIGLPAQLIEEIHARYTPQLLSFGNSRELDGDEQHLIFWIITSLLLHTVISEERHSKTKTHMSLTDILYQYNDFPLELMSSESSSRIKFICNTSMFSPYALIPIIPSQRHWNIHTTGHILSLSRRYTPSKEVTKKIFASLPHFYLHVISSVITSTLKFPIYCISDIFKRMRVHFFLLSRRLFDDLESTTSWGYLSFNFGILQMIRSACSILSLLPDDNLSIKICETLWNGVLTKMSGRRIQYYAYYTLQCIGHVTTVGQAQWRTLRALLSSSPDYNENDKPSFILEEKLRNDDMEGLKGLTTFIAPVREIPLPFQIPPYALQLQKDINKLIIIETSASLVLRSAYSEIQREELDDNSIQVVTFLKTIHDTPSYTSGMTQLIVNELISKIFKQEDALFLALNRFDFTITPKRLLLYEFHEMSERIIKENNQEESRWGVVADATRLLFEASLGKEFTSLYSWWWLICVILNSFLSMKEPKLSHVIAVILTQPLGISTERIIAMNITSYLLKIMDCKSRLRKFFGELKELCVARSSKEFLTKSVTEIITTLLQSIPP
ncbi:hypothetical protein LSM04_003032 [Trypanosoma melophagium]|uniref:uncharacterized protein n=1 Tax=Trypanosoma melophagium TaxID=715481 RepID=UPI00351A12C5|nr:hypothetical protein LSM04_003032 [Trypanosoma melophagium]